VSEGSEQFGTLPDGRPVERYVLAAGDVEVAVLTYGAVLQSVRVPDASGTPGEVTLGYDDLDGYLADVGFLGAVVGRFANRIARGRFVLDGVEHVLPANNGTACLHGGPEGFHAQLWSAREVDRGVELSRTSPDGEMGFPGSLDVTVTYLLDERGLELRYAATTDRPTVVNLSNHAYWNLSGGGTVEDHGLELPASRFVAVDAELIPTGLPLAGRVHDPRSGRVLEVRTDQPSVQFYSGNFLDGAVAGRGGRAMRQGDALCLETQHLPDSPNQPDFPSTVLRPGERYETRTLFRFGTTEAAA
jgi:aldose 1-epimerase